IGYHHEWAPGIHTLVFGARLVDNYSFTNATQPSILVVMPGTPPAFSGVQTFFAQEILQNELEIYSGEVQQILQQPSHNTILGGKAQYGHIQTVNVQGETLLAPI